MLKYLKEFYQRRVSGYSDGDVHPMEQFVRGSKPFDVVDNASNLIGNFMEVEAGRSDAAKAIVHASKRTVADIGFKGEFLEMFDLNATATIHEAALTAEKFANQLYTDKDATMAMMSDAYSLIAVICYGRLGRYRGKKDEQAIYEMAAKFVRRCSKHIQRLDDEPIAGARQLTRATPALKFTLDGNFDFRVRAFLNLPCAVILALDQKSAAALTMWSQRSSSGCTHLYGAISRCSVNLIIRTGGL